MEIKVCALIPARCGSKKIKDKNLLPLKKHPLLSYSIAAAKLCNIIDEVYVTTDSEIYRDIAIQYGAKVPFLRPTEISGDDSIDIDFFQHFIDWHSSAGLAIPDYVVHLRPTSPIRDPNIIEEAINLIHANKQATSLRSCHQTELTPYKMFYEKGSYMQPFLTDDSFPESYNLPRQKLPITFIPNGYVDIVMPKVFMNSNVLHGNKILLFKTSFIADIDDEKDYQFSKTFTNSNEFRILHDFIEAETQI